MELNGLGGLRLSRSKLKKITEPFYVHVLTWKLNTDVSESVPLHRIQMLIPPAKNVICEKSNN